MRKVYFVGELAEKFGESISTPKNKLADILGVISANRPNFREELIRYQSLGLDIDIRINNEPIKDEDMLIPLTEGDITIALIPSGAKGGGTKIAAAIAIAGFMFMAPGIFAAGGAWGTGATLTWQGTLAAGLAVNLSLVGIQELLAPGPDSDREEPQSYLFNGSEQNIIEGDPVPVLYGELRVPGIPVSFETVNRAFENNNVLIDNQGNMILVGD